MIGIYVTDVSVLPDPKENPGVMAGLSKERQEKMVKHIPVHSRKQSLGAGLLMQYVLRMFDKSIEDITYGEHGKPVIEGAYFNVSHSQNKVICAVSEYPVGCDIEYIRPVKDHVAKRCFSSREILYLSQCEEERKQSEFYRLWTIRESYLKMTGEGLTVSQDRLELMPEEPTVILRDKKKCDCYIKEYAIPGYRIAVCAKEDTFPDHMIEVFFKEEEIQKV